MPENHELWKLWFDHAMIAMLVAMGILAMGWLITITVGEIRGWVASKRWR